MRLGSGAIAQALGALDDAGRLDAFGEAPHEAGIRLVRFPFGFDSGNHQWQQPSTLFQILQVFRQILNLDDLLRTTGHLTNNHRAFHGLLLSQDNGVRHAQLLG